MYDLHATRTSVLRLALAGALLALTACQTLPRDRSTAPARFAAFVDAVGESAEPPPPALGATMGEYLDRRLGVPLNTDAETLHDTAAGRALWLNGKGYGVRWRNPATGASGMIKPTSAVEQVGTVLCRHFHDAVRLKGRREFGVDGTVCLQGRLWTVDF